MTYPKTAYFEYRERSHKPKKDMLLIVLLGIAFTLVIACLICFISIQVFKTSDVSLAETDSFYDAAVIKGSNGGKSEEQIRAELTERVKEGVFNVSIMSAIRCSSEAKGIANIENIAANVYDMTVEIRLDETDEIIYSSAGIPPGSIIKEIVLDRPLLPGKYPATATFYAFTHDEVHAYKGKLSAKIDIYVAA